MKQKLLLFYLTLISLLSVANNYASAQNNQSNKEALRMLKEFYTKYITEVYLEPNEKKLQPILRKYCTTKLLHYIPKFIEQHDEDPLLMAQDSDTSSLKTLSIKKDNKRKNIYTVSYIGNPNQKITIHLLVVKEKGSFKIDSVW